jgi:integrase
MATLRNRNNKWQARIRRSGQPDVTKTFLTKIDAEKWARSIEIEMDRATYVNSSFAEKTQFKDLIERYLKEITPTLRSFHEDTYRLKKLIKNPIAQLNLTQLTPTRIAKYRDERSSEIKPSTLLRELSHISSIINHARREWGLHIENPVNLIKKPPMSQGRNRILTDNELNHLLIELEKISPWYKLLAEFALETAMRRGELMSLLWVNINLEKSIAFLPLTKNGDSRYVPLSTKAIRILKSLPRDIDGRVFPLNKGTVSALFLRAARRAKIENVRFHDLRHMSITRLASIFSSPMELASISGHKSLSMLKRYTHFRAEDLAKKMM